MKNIIARATCLLMLILAFSQAYATVWNADNIQMVHLQDRNRYVCDPEGLLSAAVRDSADVYLRRLQTSFGIQTVFVVVNNVENADCFQFAEDVGNKYGVGRKDEDRGLVIVIAVDDRKYFIAPGKGLEEDLTDVTCGMIGRKCIVANMKEDNIDEAVFATVKAVYAKFKDGDTGLGYDDDVFDEDDDIYSFIVLGLLVGIPLYLFIRYILISLGVINPPKDENKDDDDDGLFFGSGFGGGGFNGGGFGGGSFGGGSFGGGGAGGGW